MTEDLKVMNKPYGQHRAWKRDEQAEQILREHIEYRPPPVALVVVHRLPPPRRFAGPTALHVALCSRRKPAAGQPTAFSTGTVSLHAWHGIQ